MKQYLKNVQKNQIIGKINSMGFDYVQMLPRTNVKDIGFSLHDTVDLGKFGENSFTGVFSIYIISPKDEGPEFIALVKSTIKEHTPEDPNGHNIHSKEYC